MTSTSKKTKLSNRLQDCGDTYKKFKYDTTSSSEIDEFDFISKLKRLRDINTNPINKEKTSDLLNKLNNYSDVTVYHKPRDKISNTKQKQIISDSSNKEAQKKNNLKQGTKLEVANNYAPCIMKVVGEMKHTLSKFKMQLNNLQVKNLTNKIVDQYDAKDIIFIIGCIISKLKEELKDKEELLTMSYLQQNIQHNSKQSHLYRYGKLHHNHNRKDNSQSKMSSCKRPLNNVIEINNVDCIQNDHHVSIGTGSEKSFTSTTLVGCNDNGSWIQNDDVCAKRKFPQNYSAINKVNDTIAFWNKRNEASMFSDATVIEDTAKNMMESGQVIRNSQNDNLKTTTADWKHSEKVGSVPAITRTSPTKTKKVSLGNKLTTKNTQCVQLNDVSDTYSTSSTTSFLPIKYNNAEKGLKHKNSIIDENKNKFCDGPCARSLDTCTGRKPELTSSCFRYSEETVIQKNIKHETGTCNEENASKYSTRNTEMDWDVELMNSSFSSTFSAYILPSISLATKDGNFSQKEPATTKRNEGTMNKIFMTCQVVLHKLQV